MIRGTGDDFDAISKDGPLIGYGNDFLTVRSVKLFADGALGSRGAAMLKPYADDPHNSGLLFLKPDELTAMIGKALGKGYQVGVHAIGDHANREVLDSYAAAYKTHPHGIALRNRIEHAQIVSLQDIPRFVPLQLIASMQPTHATSDMNMAEDRVGHERIKGAYAWQRFLKQGTIVAAGSDFPVESANPFYGLYSAVTRKDHNGQPPGGWYPDQDMTLVRGTACVHAGRRLCRTRGNDAGHAGAGQMGRLHPGRSRHLQGSGQHALEHQGAADLGRRETGVRGEGLIAISAMQRPAASRPLHGCGLCTSLRSSRSCRRPSE